MESEALGHSDVLQWEGNATLAGSSRQIIECTNEPFTSCIAGFSCQGSIPLSHPELLSLFLKQKHSVKVSKRVLDTDDPVIVKTKQLIAGQQNVISLAQGETLLSFYFFTSA